MKSLNCHFNITMDTTTTNTMTALMMSAAFERALNAIARVRAAAWPIPFTDEAMTLALRNMLGVDLAPRTAECVAAVMAAQRNKPWLLLTGGVGRGKTAMLRVILAAMTALPSAPRQIYASARDLALNNDLAARARAAELLAIDDLGTEPAQIMTYGTPLNPLASLIEHRYDNGLTTYITTNIDGKRLTEVYGGRVVTRLQEMAGVINYDIFYAKTLRF